MCLYSIQIFLSNFVKIFSLQRYVFMRYKLLFFIILCTFFLVLPDIQAQTGKIGTVVLDAGHGGKDCGAVGLKSKEKDITLKVALKAGEYIKKAYPEVKVYYTRMKDSSVDLYARANVANRNDADLFISIHCNSVANAPKTCGAETFVMGQHRDAANLNVAKKENASILYEENADEHYGGFDPNSTETYIAMSYIQSEYKEESLQFAELVQNELVNNAKRSNRGVQQAGFMVLYKTAMPSILVELGFISNPTEENFMMSEDGQKKLASAIFNAFKTYKTNYEKETATISKNFAEPSDNQTINPNVGIVYKVQFATKNRKVENPSSTYKNLKNVDYYEHNGVFKYTTGCFLTAEEAENYRKEVAAKGYEGAFVVKFENGKRK